MWTAKNRGRYDRSALRYPSDLTDDEWALVEPLIPPARRGGNKRHVDEREVMNGIMYILSTGCQWRAIPKDLPPRSTVHDYLDLWSYDGTLDRIITRFMWSAVSEANAKTSPTAALPFAHQLRGHAHEAFRTRHEQRRGHPFARDVSDKETERSVRGGEEIIEIAPTSRAGWTSPHTSTGQFRAGGGNTCGSMLICRSRAASSSCSSRKRQPFDELAACHSITSSAMDSSPGGTSMPSASAVFKLIRNSNLVACTTARSAGFSPLRIRPV